MEHIHIKGDYGGSENSYLAKFLFRLANSNFYGPTSQVLFSGGSDYYNFAQFYSHLAEHRYVTMYITI